MLIVLGELQIRVSLIYNELRMLNTIHHGQFLEFICPQLYLFIKPRKHLAHENDWIHGISHFIDLSNMHTL